ncbi:Uncharacterised protein [Cedecea neteri]|uniref:Uncharacterized protein n=1 Tax=Cedecea neteri TaxID=158822 RepID=A0A2X2V4S7_9ENTR|nr:Uncharacterised protein [Cedecea neteri]
MNLTLEKGNWQQEISGDVATKIKDGSYSLDVTGGRRRSQNGESPDD